MYSDSVCVDDYIYVNVAYRYVTTYVRNPQTSYLLYKHHQLSPPPAYDGTEMLPVFPFTVITDINQSYPIQLL